MKPVNLMKIIAIAFFGILSLGFCYLILPWLLIFLDISLSPAPPTPVNTYGEFPMRLEYEIDGERFIVEDTLICEYIGAAMDEGSGKYLKWDMRLKSGETQLARGTGEYVLFLGDMGSTSIYCDTGSPQYYLGYRNYGDYSPGRVIISGYGYNGIIREEELMSEYGIKMLACEFSEPMIGNGIEGASEYSDVAREAAKGLISTPKQPSYPAGTTQIIFIWENTTDKTMGCSSSFYIQKETDGKWFDVYREYAARFPMLERLYLEPHSQFTYICDIGIYTPDIPGGKYRVVSNVEVPIAERTYELKVLCGEFVIE